MCEWEREQDPKIYIPKHKGNYNIEWEWDYKHVHYTPRHKKEGTK